MCCLLMHFQISSSSLFSYFLSILFIYVFRYEMSSCLNQWLISQETMKHEHSNKVSLTTLIYNFDMWFIYSDFYNCSLSMIIVNLSLHTYVTYSSFLNCPLYFKVFKIIPSTFCYLYMHLYIYSLPESLNSFQTC